MVRGWNGVGRVCAGLSAVARLIGHERGRGRAGTRRVGARGDGVPAAAPPQPIHPINPLSSFLYLRPRRLVPPHAPHIVFKPLPLAQAVLRQLRLILDLLFGRLELGVLQLAGLQHDLFGGDLE